MDNQRRPPNTPTTFNRNKNFRKGGERSAGYSKYPPRDSNRFQQRGERFQKPEGLQQRDDRFGKRPGKFQPRNDKFQPRDRFAPRGKSPAPDWKTEPKVKIVSELQITDGKHRGKYIQTSASPRYPITPRKVREAVFKILFRKIRARRFLDLCAGSGIVGLEAISRGSIISTFVERSAKMCGLIRKNLESLEIKIGHGEIVEMEVEPFLKKMAKRRRTWDVVFFETPASENYDGVVKFLSRGKVVAPGGTVVIEHPSEVFMPERLGVLKRWRVVVQGDRAISFFERR